MLQRLKNTHYPKLIESFFFFFHTKYSEVAVAESKVWFCIGHKLILLPKHCSILDNLFPNAKKIMFIAAKSYVMDDFVYNLAFKLFALYKYIYLYSKYFAMCLLNHSSKCRNR